MARPKIYADDVADRFSPTVRRRVLGIELRKLRKAAGLTAEDAADRLDMDRTLLSRIETGHRPIRKDTLIALLSTYKAPARRREELAEVHASLRQPAWWKPLKVIEGSFVDLEAEATDIRSWDALLIPGLFQTEEYIAAFIRTAGVAAEEQGQRVSVRTQRGELLDQGLKLWAIVGEAALRTTVGGPKVMSEQLTHLADRAELPNATVQVLPFDAGEHVGLEGSFAVLMFDEHPPLGYTEMWERGTWYEREPDVEAMRNRWERLLSAAMKPAHSVKLVRTIAREMEQDE